MEGNNWKQLIEEKLDSAYLRDVLSRILQVPTDVPFGQNFMEPDDPKLVNYVQNVLKPELERIGVPEIIDAPKNQLLVPLGSGEKDTSLLFMCFTPAQHAQWSKEPYSGRIGNGKEFGYDEDCAFGAGAGQNKGAMAAMLTVLKLLVDSKIGLKGRLYFAINNEGRSSQECSEALIRSQNLKADFGMECYGVERDGECIVTLGHRGRVDIDVTIKGKTGHSSHPHDALSAIEAAYEVMTRLRAIELDRIHPNLGQEQLTIYKMVFSPIAPHTLPDRCEIAIDRRMLPGTSPDFAVEQVRRAIGDLSPYEVSVEKGVYMLPLEVSADAPIVKAIKQSSRLMTGREATSGYIRWAFDAGGPTSLGIPTVMYGPRPKKDYTSEDFQPISLVVDFAKTYAHVILSMLM